MRNVAIGILFFLFVLASCSDQLKTDSDQSVIKVVEKFHAAFDAKDIPALTEVCTADMCWFTLNGKSLQRDAIAGFFHPMFANWDSVSTKIKELQMRRTNHLAVVRYKSDIHIVVRQRQVIMRNVHTLILLNDIGGWKIWQHHMSSE